MKLWQVIAIPDDPAITHFTFSRLFSTEEYAREYAESFKAECIGFTYFICPCILEK